MGAAQLSNLIFLLHIFCVRQAWTIVPWTGRLSTRRHRSPISGRCFRWRSLRWRRVRWLLSAILTTLVLVVAVVGHRYNVTSNVDERLSLEQKQMKNYFGTKIITIISLLKPTLLFIVFLRVHLYSFYTSYHSISTPPPFRPQLTYPYFYKLHLPRAQGTCEKPVLIPSVAL